MDLPASSTPLQDFLIIGAGLSGLTAAYQLHRHNETPLMLEARERVGGRALTVHTHSAVLDVGPSWIWPGQPVVASLLTHLNIPLFPQYSAGDLVHQSSSGEIRRNSYLKPMGNALRVEGGVGRVVEALHSGLPAGAVRLSTSVYRMELVGGVVKVWARVEVGGSCVERVYASRRVVFAMPPRQVAKVEMRPRLPRAVEHGLREVATWMGSHAKFHAVYEFGFWREKGLSGDAFSEKGPLREIHDASASSAEGPFVLFGFFGFDARRRLKVGETELVKLAVEQLVEVFGSEAARPVVARVTDWSREQWTATEADQRMLDYHPEYGRPVGDLGEWNGRLEFIGSEMNEGSGGLIEGAVRQGAEFADSVLREKGVEVPTLPV